VLEDSTGSDVTIFSSEEDEDGNEPDSRPILKKKLWKFILHFGVGVFFFFWNTTSSEMWRCKIR
jgi:hypothetical protein